jgi:hypothetical protein
MGIEYKTEGKVQIECANGNAKPIAVTWMLDDTMATIHGGGDHIAISKSQLLALADMAMRIASDLAPNRVVAGSEP